MNAPTLNIVSLSSAHVFRSKFIDSLSHLEGWTISTWRRVAEPTGSKGKIPHHLGNRMRKLRDLTRSHPEVFASPSRIAQLLGELEPYCRLRATLAHGNLQSATASDGVMLLIVDNPLDEQHTAFVRRVSLKVDELDEIICSVDKLIGELVACS